MKLDYKSLKCTEFDIDNNTSLDYLDDIEIKVPDDSLELDFKPTSTAKTLFRAKSNLE